MKTRGNIDSRILCLAILASVMTGCSVMPTYERPTLDIPGSYKEAFAPSLEDKEVAGNWKIGEPAPEELSNTDWSVFQDEQLTDLQSKALAGNQDIAAKVAQLGRARALIKDAQAAYYPSVSASTGPTRQRISSAGQYLPDGDPGISQSYWRAQVSVAYEVDLFGKTSSAVAATRANYESKQNDLAALKLLVQADVASTYFLLRQLDSEIHLTQGAVANREKTISLIERQLVEGIIRPGVLSSAQAELAKSRATLTAAQRQRAIVEHALAVLLGRAPSDFFYDSHEQRLITVDIPPGLPSSLLERRPDIASAERRMAAANAEVGVAKAAYFPALSLTGSAGYESSSLGNLFNWSQRTFLLGPLVGAALSLPIFDGGRREATIEQARARYQEEVASYRGTVLKAFREVEDSLVSIRTLDEEMEQLRVAQAAAQSASSEAQNRFEIGDSDYLFYLDAQRTLIEQQLELVRTQGARLRASVDLIRALGGGWRPLN
ncbi:efflux transporter outer membrane subunit [Burkholderia multivorans]|nr:efflux transporter outer membrane subunit [Burkholderia multivorans]MDN7886732.1 efflux transporter outer membrane subunit [Burkholderia multivorans]MDN7976978.1 efflux transporter outer membrane subunit [Burkholderia multivorans]MDN7982553.1 efflux transporter outer membrane subunit [Burkholderia multivorans]MDN7988163.1 efflux transporter outer membrane subunit [Burkholderia multivorans]